MAAGFSALGDDDVGTCVDVAFGVRPGSSQGCNLHPGLMAALDHVRRWWPEGVGHQGGPMDEGDVNLSGGPVGRKGCVHRASSPPIWQVVGLRGNPVPVQHVCQEVAVLFGDEGEDVVHAEAAVSVARVPCRNDQVHAIGEVTYLVLDPGKVHLEALVAVAHGSQHAEPSGL